jgi:hypothetical protein
VARNFIDQANHLRYEYISAVDSLEKWKLAGDFLESRKQILEGRHTTLPAEGVSPLQGHRPKSIFAHIASEIQMVDIELEAHERHDSVFAQAPDRKLGHSQTHFEEHREEYFDYAVYLARILGGVDIIVGGEVQAVSQERVYELEGRTKPNPYAPHPLLPPARCLDREPIW